MWQYEFKKRNTELKYYKSVYPNSKKIKEIIKKLTMCSN